MGNSGSTDAKTVVVAVELPAKAKAGAWHDELVLVGAHDTVGWDPASDKAIAFVPCHAIAKHAKKKKPPAAGLRYVAVVALSVLQGEHKLALRTSAVNAATKTKGTPAAASEVRWEPLPGVMANRPAIGDGAEDWPCIVMRWGDYANSTGSNAQAEAARNACGASKAAAALVADSSASRGAVAAGGAGRGPEGRRPSDDPASDDGVVVDSAADVDAVDDGGAFLKPADYAADSKAYAAELGPHQLRSFELGPSYSGYHYASDAKGASATSRGGTALKKVLRELRDIKKGAALPLEPGSSIFLRYDKTKPCALQALIIGPGPDTPYAGGCFLFDIWIPPTYPDAPPKVNLATTGGGTVRFNPNLYNSGYVCLSLLGTWTGTSPTQNWQPKKSTILQVLVSIQSEIMGVQYPIYNEPGLNGGSGDSKAARTSINGGYERLRVATMQWAMVDMLRKPPAGFEDVVRAHFRLRKEAVRATCDAWAADAAKSDTAGHKDAIKAQRKALDAELRKL